MKHLNFKERAKQCKHPLSKKLFQLIHEKQTNLALSADLTRTNDIIQLVQQVGDEICILKTHVDIIEDFSIEFINELQALATKHRFILFEDRKFSDIGNTVLHQYEHGVYHIADWADIVNAHLLPGEGVITGLKRAGLAKQRGLLLVAQMSSKENYFTPEYTEQCIKLAKQHKDFVIGFICQEKLSDDPDFIHMTPGIKFNSNEDSLGQGYLTPEYVIKEKLSDIIIVGRGIYASKNSKQAASAYRQAAWDAVLIRTSNMI